MNWARRLFITAPAGRCRWLKFVDDVQQGMQAMEKIKGNNAANFAYPYGHVTLGSKTILGPVLTSSRSIFPGSTGRRSI